ncbi:hypothetical protein [Antribacter gilvus]|uniref:hypothetical protein n=1 Tax=Antribacter gilvus TaxID=2304675 RepID=UPI000F76771B|nr:hypothetical protein [Antribacter gilvus]
MKRTMRTRAMAGAVTVLAAGMLAGCAAEVPVPEADPVTTGPALTVEQEAEVVTSVSTVLEKASAENNTAVLAERLAGPALASRTSQLTVAAAIGDAKYVTPLPSQMVQIVVPVTETWPRTSYGVSKQEGTKTPALVVMDQPTARDPYKLWAWVRLIPGITLPQFAPPDVGSEAPAADDASLIMTPADAVAQYADVLTTGDTSAFAPAFEPDVFRKQVTDKVAEQLAVENFAAAEGKYTVTFTPRGDAPVHAVRTLDGGAVVIGVLDATDLVTVQTGGTAPPSPNFPSQKVHFGAQPVTNVLRTTYLDTVALYVPPAGSTEKVSLLGYEQVVVGASNK